jgi:tetratricopeptide (TPR) repeat protein
MNAQPTIFLAAFMAGLGGCASIAGTPSGTAPAQALATPAPATPATAPDVNREPTDPNVMFHVMAGEMALQRGQADVAVPHFAEAARRSKNLEVIERAARVADFANDATLGVEMGRLWVDADPKSFDARQVYSNALLRSGNPNAALHEIEVIILLVNGDKQIFPRIASQLSREKNQDAALDLMDRLARRYRDNPYAQIAYAQLATRFGRLPLALSQIDAAIQLKPDWPDALVLRAHVLQMSNRFDEALALYSDALKDKFADNFTLRMSYARLLLDLKRFPEAHEQYAKLAEQEPDNGDVVYAAALLSMQTNHFDQAEKLLLNLLKLRERTSETAYYLGQIAEKNKRLDEALDWYDQVGNGEFYINARMRKSSIMAKQGLVEEALSALRTIRTSTQQEQMQLFMMEGDIHLESGNHNKAFDIYDRALKDMPDNNNLLYARALAAEKLDRIDIAEQDLRNILKSEPDNVQALNALGYTLADRTQRFHEALTYIQRALTLEPKDAAIIDSMGWVQFRMGNHTEAIQYLQKALEISQDSEIAAHLGEVLWTSGKKDEAIAVFEQARKNFPDSPQLIKVMRRFGL